MAKYEPILMQRDKNDGRVWAVRFGPYMTIPTKYEGEAKRHGASVLAYDWCVSGYPQKIDDATLAEMGFSASVQQPNWSEY